MSRFRRPSPQTLAALAAFLEAPRTWRHGYELSAATGLKSGTLYPLLMRLSKQGMLESDWRDSDQPGRPARHVYRLTLDGLAFARQNGTASAPAAFGRSAPAR
jgi:DNA-binding PadR family transcriptional regulator